jgi:hypothetical protein
MRCKRFVLQLVAAIICIAVPSSDLRGNEVLVILPPQTVKSLEGIVVVKGISIEHAIVAEFASDYKTEIRRTTTDAQGQFRLVLANGRRTYYLQITGPGGVNPAVRISRTGKALLNIPLHLA